MDSLVVVAKLVGMCYGIDKEVCNEIGWVCAMRVCNEIGQYARCGIVTKLAGMRYEFVTKLVSMRYGIHKEVCDGISNPNSLQS